MRPSWRVPTGGSDPVYRCRQPSVRQGLGPASTPASFSARSAPTPWGGPAQARGSKETLLLQLWRGAGGFGCAGGPVALAEGGSLPRGLSIVAHSPRS